MAWHLIARRLWKWGGASHVPFFVCMEESFSSVRHLKVSLCVKIRMRDFDKLEFS